MIHYDEALWKIAQKRIWAIDWLDTTVESGNYSDTYFKELTQMLAFSINGGVSKRLTIDDGEMEACNNALAIAEFLIKDAGFRLFQQSSKTDTGYIFFDETVLLEVDWESTNNQFDIFANIMRERSKLEQLSREYYGECYGYDYYLGRVNKKFIPPIPEELVESLTPYTGY